MLSVIVPVYNARDYLEKCIYSILNAIEEEDEIIIIDDMSTDGSNEFLDDLSKRHHQIRKMTQQHLGASAARNRGLMEARGEFITFIDADDYIEKEMFQDMLMQFESDVNIVMCGQQKLTASGYLMNPINYDSQKIKILDGKREAFYDCFYKDYTVSVWGKIYKKEIIDKYQIRFNSNLVILEDMCFLADYLSKCNGKIVRMSERYYTYRISDYARLPIDKFAMQENAYQYVRGLASEIDNNLGICVEMTYVDKLSRYIAKMFADDRKSDLGKAAIANFKKHAGIVRKSGQERAWKNLFYTCLYTFPGTLGLLLKTILKITRKMGKTID